MIITNLTLRTKMDEKTNHEAEEQKVPAGEEETEEETEEEIE